MHSRFSGERRQIAEEPRLPQDGSEEGSGVGGLGKLVGFGCDPSATEFNSRQGARSRFLLAKSAARSYLLIALHEFFGLNDMSDPSKSSNNARVGMVFFMVYLALYGGFVLMNAFAPSAMEAPFLFDVNLAVGYGMVLIVSAFALALLYAWWCRERQPEAKS